MRRRTWLGVGVGIAAAGVGAGWARWRHGDGENALTPTQDAAVWSGRYDRPGGGELALASLRGRPLLLNFWATWCPPCVKEMPLLDAFQRERAGQGWQVVGLAIDGPTPVREFLARRPVGFAIGLAGMDGMDLVRSLGNAGGQLPYSVVFDRQGRIRERRLGAVDEHLLVQWAQAWA